MRVVFDTNVLVAALVFPGGQGDAALRRVVEGRDQLVLSRAILGELLEVLGRKFARDAEELAHVAVFVSDLATVVAPKRRLRVVKDDPDNRILECALAGKAEAIVTGDKGLLALKSFEGIPLMTLASYLGRP
ncbi:MAG: putative toxin-antitoxin system toxin component, PIN family [Burkholderiales bacterium]|nr:putative toxin-antitoxin system toxin component, PIN family [Burkholderiales bacterium]